MAFNPNQPRIVSWQDLTQSLARFLDTRSMRHDLHDLWKMGAPVPGKPGEAEKRILFPQEFAQWWQIHVAGRHAQSTEYTMFGGMYVPKRGK